MAIEIDNTAGNLASNIGESCDVTELIVTGEINAADIDFISNELKQLQGLDLSAASIVAYAGERVLTGGTEYCANELPDYALMGLKATSITLPSSLTSIGEGALTSTCVESIAIPEGVTSIGAHAFADCRNLSAISLPNSVTSIGEGLFMGCVNLSSATFSESITTLPDRTFENCSSLAEVSILAVTNIGKRAFLGCSALKNIALPSSLTAIGAEAFYGSGIETAELRTATSLATIGDFAIAKCESLTEVLFGDVSPTLGRGVFFDDSALAYITLPASTTVIPEFTFKGTTVINPEVIREGVTEIKDYALTGWANIEDFKIPSTLNTIGSGAMANWENIGQIDVTDVHQVPELGDHVWRNVDQASIILYVDTADEEAYASAAQWNEFTIKNNYVESDATIEADATSGITLRYNKPMLTISSKGEEIVFVEIFDLNGRARYANKSESATAEVDTSDLAGGNIVVRITLADGSITSAKLLLN